MKRTQLFRSKIFLPLFLLLTAVSAISSAVATAAVSTGRSPVPSTAIAILMSLAVCALASQLISRGIALDSSRLVASMASHSDLSSGKRTPRSLLFAEVATAWDKAALRSERATYLEQQRTTHGKTDMVELIRTMSKALEERSPHLRGHSERVSEYAVAIAEELELDKQTIERVRLAGLVHDIGMISVGDASLKKSRLLEVREFEILRAHPARGAAILRAIESLHDLIPAVELHHEALDGTGYPYGLAHQDIPLLARILAVADTFDATTSLNSSQPEVGRIEAIETLKNLAGTRLDAHVVDALVRSLERRPAGTKDTMFASSVIYVKRERAAEARIALQAL